MNSHPRHSLDDLEDVVKNFVATRPRRPRQGRIIGGVAAGIGRRYGIDPVLVRVALGVSAVYGGSGVIFYLLGLLLLAEDGDEVSPLEALIGRGRSSASRGLTLIWCVALIPITSLSLSYSDHFSTIAGGLVLLASMYLLHRYRGDRGIAGQPGPTATTTAGTPTGAPTPGGTPPVADAVPTAHLDEDGFRTEPPKWDPLGAAPFAWDLPEPGPEPAVEPEPPLPVRRRPRVGLATLGIVIITGAVLGVLSHTVHWLGVPHILGVLAAVVGVGLVVGSVLHAGRWLIPLAVLLSAVGLGATATHFDGWHGAGNAFYQPRSVSDVRAHYQRSFGNLEVDLTRLPNSGTVSTSVQQGVGDLTVIVPARAEVHATCDKSIGDLDCLGQHVTGANNDTIFATQDAPGAPGADHLTINLEVLGGPGNVEVISRG